VCVNALRKYSWFHKRYYSNTVHDHLCEVDYLDVVVVDEFTVRDDFHYFSLAHALSHFHHHRLEFLHWDFAIIILVEYFDSIDNVVKSISVLSTLADQIFKTLKVELTSGVTVYLSFHLVDFTLSRVEVDSSHYCPKFLGVDEAITVLVKEHEDFLNLTGSDVSICFFSSINSSLHHYLMLN
jgi:hypothetical protein